MKTSQHPKRALISVSDKRGLLPFVQQLIDVHGYSIISSGGTARALSEAGLPVTEIEDYTGFPEMLGGRVKTLHPKVHAALLALRDDSNHLAELEGQAISPIDLAVVNLYPFEQALQSRGMAHEAILEQLDIGGPCLLRSAAKNYASVTAVSDPEDYPRVLGALSDTEELKALRAELAFKAFTLTARYDQSIAAYLETQGEQPDLSALSGFPQVYNASLDQGALLRYGENPHQQAALYGDFFKCFDQIQGKPLSYNNILDASNAVYLIGEFEKATVAILKHTNPCGVASADTVEAAWEAALATDQKSPFGGIIIANRTIDGALAETMSALFCELIMAPAFTDDAKACFSKKKNLRLLQVRGSLGAEVLQEVRSVVGGLLVQDRDKTKADPTGWRVVTECEPLAELWPALFFGWRVVKHVKSNAIVFASAERTLGIGAGQMSRIDSIRLGCMKAEDAGLSLKGSIMASDAFFPFPDAVEAAARAGVRAIITPGGSIRDQAVIDAANAHDIALIFTGTRHFKH